MSGALSSTDTLVLLRDSGALLTGHFRLSSGAHSDSYFQCARALELPARAERLGAGIASLFEADAIDAVAAPALGGLVIGHEVARALRVRFVFAEREEKRFAFRRGFAVSQGERLLLVEDVLTTGGSVMELRDLAKRQGAVAVGIGAIVDRSGGSFRPDLSVRTLVSLDVPLYLPDSCPLCARGVPVEKPGSRPA
jgi:orotate phosphoribosyltransferase